MRPSLNAKTPPAALRAIVATACNHLQAQAGAAAVHVMFGEISASMIDAPSHLALSRIARAIAVKHGITVDDLRRPHGEKGARLDVFVRPRQEAYWLARQLADDQGRPRYDYARIGRFFGNRDRSAVIVGAKRYARRLEAESAQ